MCQALESYSCKQDKIQPLPSQVFRLYENDELLGYGLTWNVVGTLRTGPNPGLCCSGSDLFHSKDGQVEQAKREWKVNKIYRSLKMKEKMYVFQDLKSSVWLEQSLSLEEWNVKLENWGRSFSSRVSWKSRRRVRGLDRGR